MRLLLLLIILFLSVCLGLYLNQDPGYLLIVIKSWRIETTLFTAIVLLSLLFIILHYSLIIFTKIRKLPKVLHNWRQQRRINKAQTRTQQGLIEFSEGYWAAAKNNLITSLKYTPAPLLNYLTAAKAAQEMGDSNLRDDYLREAQQSMPDAKIAVELTQAQLQLADKQWEQALASLKHLQGLAPHHPYVLKLLFTLYKEIGDWQQLITLLPELKYKKIISESEYNSFLYFSYKELLLNFIKQQDRSGLERLMADLPRNFFYDPQLITLYSTFLIKIKNYEEAEKILRAVLKKNFHPSLIRLYGQVEANSKQQLIFAESFLKKFANSAELALCIGRLSIANNLWGKAKHYFTISINLLPTPIAYAEMGNLLVKLGEQDDANEAYKNGLLLAVDLKKIK